jgi:hypothetical protein
MKETPPYQQTSGACRPPARRVCARAESFYGGVVQMFERWVARRPSLQTQRAYRRVVLRVRRLPWHHLARERLVERNKPANLT